jgi:hypothetical protein
MYFTRAGLGGLDFDSAADGVAVRLPAPVAVAPELSCAEGEPVATVAVVEDAAVECGGRSLTPGSESDVAGLIHAMPESRTKAMTTGEPNLPVRISTP